MNLLNSSREIVPEWSVSSFAKISRNSSAIFFFLKFEMRPQFMVQLAHFKGIVHENAWQFAQVE